MRKLWYLLPVFGAIISFVALYGLGVGPKKPIEAATHDVTLTTTVVTYLTFDITAGDTVSFGNLTPGTPIKAPATGTVASVTTNSEYGYSLSLSDATATPDSSMVHTDTTTHIAKYAGTITTPTAWTGNGLGVTLFAADSTPDAKWCAATCTTYDDTDNKYAGVPETAAVVHSVSGFHSGADTSSWAFEVNVPNTQKTGAYSGTTTFTATALLS